MVQHYPFDWVEQTSEIEEEEENNAARQSGGPRGRIIDPTESASEDVAEDVAEEVAEEDLASDDETYVAVFLAHKFRFGVNPVSNQCMVGPDAKKEESTQQKSSPIGCHDFRPAKILKLAVVHLILFLMAKLKTKSLRSQ